MAKIELDRTFKELYLDGKIEFEAIDDYVSYWNYSDMADTLAKFLGLNEEEEAVWIDESEEAFRDMLDKQKK